MRQWHVQAISKAMLEDVACHPIEFVKQQARDYMDDEFPEWVRLEHELIPGELAELHPRYGYLRELAGQGDDQWVFVLSMASDREDLPPRIWAEPDYRWEWPWPVRLEWTTEVSER